MLLVVLVTLAFYLTPREVANWYHAAALEVYLVGDSEAAIRYINRSIEWSPDKLDGYVTRSEIYQRLGRHKEAIRDQDRIVEIYRASTNLPLDNALNNRAYYRALGEIELDEGLEDVQQAIQIVGDERASFLDTRGYLHYLLGNLDSAEIDLVRATELAEQDYDFAIRKIDQISHVGLREKQRTQYDHYLAVIYHHLGLLYQKQNRHEQADHYLGRGDALGYDPEQGIW